jgi:hypothetical protein
MASSRAVATMLATFAEVFPTRDLDANTAPVWERILSGVADDTLGLATMRLCREPGRRFFPSSGEVFDAIAKDAPGVDVLTILHRIEQLGHYDPHRGWVYPNYEMIRRELGEEIAKAYTVAGANNLFAEEAKDGNSITRDIARRSFATEVERVNKATPERLRLPPPREHQVMPLVEGPKIRTPRLLKPGEKTPMAGIVTKVMDEIIAEQIPEPAETSA